VIFGEAWGQIPHVNSAKLCGLGSSRSEVAELSSTVSIARPHLPHLPTRWLGGLDLGSETMFHMGMSNASLVDLTITQLQRAIALKEKIVSLTDELNSLLGASDAQAGVRRGAKRKYTRRAAREEAEAPKPTEKKRRKFSKAARAKMRVAAKARWAAVKAKGQSKL
jgi:hypothetical protein